MTGPRFLLWSWQPRKLNIKYINDIYLVVKCARGVTQILSSQATARGVAVELSVTTTVTAVTAMNGGNLIYYYIPQKAV